MLWYNCPICGLPVDFDYDANTLPIDDDNLPTVFDDVETHHFTEGELWCTKCKRRFLFKEHWKISLEDFTTTEIEY